MPRRSREPENIGPVQRIRIGVTDDGRVVLSVETEHRDLSFVTTPSFARFLGRRLFIGADVAQGNITPAEASAELDALAGDEQLETLVAEADA